ncbi:MAG: peptide chain release factor N(5)-glutamine methyltransferase [Gemmatimonadetes bacterium]|nr:peptide chain release factor N(5)-glutamine methyltransferase [Gemmatimonadota bacterium]
MPSPLRKPAGVSPRRPPRTIGDEIEWATRKLARSRRPDPRKAALATWATLARETPGAVWLKRHARSPAELALRYRRAVADQAAGAPFQYTVGTAAFRTLELLVDRAVLIPRVETEDLVSHVLRWAEDRHGDGQWGIAADIGTGSGAIAIALALEGRFERVIATDVSGDALAVARRNVESVAAGVPIELRQGSLLEPLGETRCMVVVSNPPYLTTAECRETPAEVRDYEPLLALDGGPEGLEPYRTLVAAAARYLHPGGLLALELDSRRAMTVHSLALASGWADARILPDAFGRARYLLATNWKGIP